MEFAQCEWYIRRLQISGLRFLYVPVIRPKARKVEKEKKLLCTSESASMVLLKSSHQAIDGSAEIPWLDLWTRDVGR